MGDQRNNRMMSEADGPVTAQRRSKKMKEYITFLSFFRKGGVPRPLHQIDACSPFINKSNKIVCNPRHAQNELKQKKIEI